MPAQCELRTERLLLRPFVEEDAGAFAALNADPRVMEHFERPLSRDESDALLGRIRAGAPEEGFGLWAVEIPERVPFIGFVGLTRPSFTAPFTPCVEIGWRLARACWNQGYATEAALASLAFGFEQLGLSEILSWTATENRASRRVMEKIGMTHDPSGDFDHPRLPRGHRLERHVLYRIARP